MYVLWNDSKEIFFLFCVQGEGGWLVEMVMRRQGEAVGMLPGTEAAHHIIRDGILRQKMMESLNHWGSTPNAPQVSRPLSMWETHHQVKFFFLFFWCCSFQAPLWKHKQDVSQKPDEREKVHLDWNNSNRNEDVHWHVGVYVSSGPAKDEWLLDLSCGPVSAARAELFLAVPQRPLRSREQGIALGGKKNPKTPV